MSTVLRYDGSSWRKVYEPDDAVTSISGTGPDDVYLATAASYKGSGSIVHFDGSSWTTLQIGTRNRLITVWASDNHGVYAAGSDGTILHRCSP